MKHIFQILLLLIPLLCRSQQKTIDSLQRLLATATTDSARFQLAYNIVSIYRYTRYDSALYYTNKALLLAQKNGKKLNEASALTYKGFLLNRLQRLTESYQVLTTALQIAEDPRNENSFWNTMKPEVKDKDYRISTLAGIHNRLGIFMENVGKGDQAMFHYRQAMKIYSAIGDSLGVALINTNLGAWYWNRLNKPDSALLFEQAAESIFVQKKEQRVLGLVYAVMGSSYLDINNDGLGLAYLHNAISVNKKYNSPDILEYTYRGLTNFYIQEKNKDSALYYARMAANIHISVNTMDLGDDFHNLAKSYELNHQRDSAYKYEGIALANYDSLYRNRIKGLTGFQQLSFDEQQQLQQLEADKIEVQNRTKIYTLLTGLGVILLIGVFLYRSNQQQKRANLLLQQQKDEIDNKNKELEIESALEKVRSRSLAMHKSDELEDLVTVVFQKLKELGFLMTDAGITFVTLINDSKDVIHWSVSPDLASAPVTLRLPYFDHPMNIDFFSARENGIGFYSKIYSQEEKNAFYNHAFVHSDYKYLSDELKNWMLKQGNIALTFALEKTSTILFFSYAGHQLSESNAHLLKRFSAVFDQSYIRFLDLQKAEAQTREAQIEAALERVRSRSMAMQKSEELREVIQVIFDQLYGLHFNLDTASFAVEIDETNDLKNWVASPLAQYATRIDLPYIDHPAFNRLIEAKEKGEEFSTFLFSKEEKDGFFDHYFKFATVSEERKSYVYNSRSWVGSSVLMKKIALSINNYSGIPYSEQENKTLVRFGKAFEQTYTRFLDLQRAEGNAKEALRQASVDRVRAEIATMRTTKDLDRIIPLVWNELTTLNIPFIRCGVFIVNELLQQTHVYLSTPDGKAIAAFQLPFNRKGLNEELLQHWRDNQIFKDHWNATTFSEWTHNLVEAGAIQRDEHYSNEKPPENLYLHFVPFMQGMLYVGNTEPLLPNELSLIESLAGAFSTAYARYEDFSKLETAKQQIETALTELKATQSQLIQKEKMASLGELTAGIAHEIQNPLNFVNNFSEVNKELIEELKGERSKVNGERDEELEAKILSDLSENLEKIAHHGKRAEVIVKSMLQHSQKTTGKKEPTDIDALADEYLRLSYHGFRAKDKSFNATIETNFDESIGKIEVIPQDIGRVLLNLFNNAFYAVNEKKKQLNGTFEPIVEVSTKRVGDKIELSVKDNGSGIPRKVVDKIFQPFFTTKPTGQGTGLGLSLSYDIVKAHGGEIKVESKEGEESVLLIRLPM